MLITTIVFRSVFIKYLMYPKRIFSPKERSYNETISHNINAYGAYIRNPVATEIDDN
jgi:hypothetical protein